VRSPARRSPLAAPLSPLTRPPRGAGARDPEGAGLCGQKEPGQKEEGRRLEVRHLVGRLLVVFCFAEVACTQLAADCGVGLRNILTRVTGWLLRLARVGAVCFGVCGSADCRVLWYTGASSALASSYMREFLMRLLR
jgi:hypothetical protein